MAEFVNEYVREEEGEQEEILELQQPNPGEDIQHHQMALDFNHEEVLHALKPLSLNAVTLGGDYIVVMNGEADTTIRGEPYLALQFWLDVRSGDYIGRVWSQTVSYGKVANVTQFVEACANHFRGRPCLGYPLDEDDKHEMMMSRDV